ncbi:hypothetical protein [Spirosoma validum]|uniref:Uncharacterized protein n=1 Tax=Spirosoma validum TaxID=2771355 RepID=A0A927B6X9_9BACT|nr:hypothetical protein [Spirosoma validum]MBD2756331.1 hypothetical protein [Spirosoma validum]
MTLSLPFFTHFRTGALSLLVLLLGTGLLAQGQTIRYVKPAATGTGVIIRIAELNRDAIHDLPIRAREHFHLSTNVDLSKSSSEVIVGRLDTKGTGNFYNMYVSKDEQAPSGLLQQPLRLCKGKKARASKKASQI